MDLTRFVVSTNDVILNHSYRDMEVGASYVKSLQKARTMKWSLLSYNIINFNKTDYFVYRHSI